MPQTPGKSCGDCLTKQWFLTGTHLTPCKHSMEASGFYFVGHIGSSLNIFKVSLLRFSVVALAELAHRWLGVTDLCCDWMWFKSRSNLWPYCLCSPSQWFKPLITLATHWNHAFFFFFFSKHRANSQEQYSAQSLVPLATVPTFTVNDVSLTPIVPGGIYRLACCC